MSGEDKGAALAIWVVYCLFWQEWQPSKVSGELLYGAVSFRLYVQVFLKEIKGGQIFFFFFK